MKANAIHSMESVIQAKFGDARIPSKSFVSPSVVVLVFLISIVIWLSFFLYLIRFDSIILTLLGIVLFFAVWHRVYQVVFDLKLLRFLQKESLPSDVLLDSNGDVSMSIIIPSFEEPYAVAKLTFDSAVKAPFSGRKQIIVVDNSSDRTSHDYRLWRSYVENYQYDSPRNNVDALFIHNFEIGKLKPGNIDIALRQAINHEFVLILDVDSTLPSQGNLLDTAVNRFKTEPYLGCLQFLIVATNCLASDFAQIVGRNQDLMRLRMIARGFGGFKIFEGHNGIMRSSALKIAGPWTQYFKNRVIISEDVLKTLDIYEAGYYSSSLNVATGEWVPMSIKSLESMWMRWMYGNSQVFFKSSCKIFSTRLRPLELMDLLFHVLQHGVAMMFFCLLIGFQLLVEGNLTNIFVLVLYVLPQMTAAVVSIRQAISRQEGFELRQLALYYKAFFLIDIFIMSTQIRSSIRFLRGLAQSWRVTGKTKELHLDINSYLADNIFHFGLSGCCLLVPFVSIFYLRAFQDINVMNYAGSMFTAINLFACLLLFKNSDAGDFRPDGASIDEVYGKR